MPLLAWHGVNRSDRERLLRRHAATLSRDGAACAIAAGRTGLDVELLEVGRAVLWSQTLGLRPDLSALTTAAPELAEQLRPCRTALNAPHHRPGSA